MALTINKTVLFDGERDSVIHFNITGTDGPVETLLAYSTLAGSPTSIKIARVIYTARSASAFLLWGADVNETFLEIPDNDSNDLNFYSGEMGFGGIVDTPFSTGLNQNIMITTKSMAAGDGITIILYIKKRFD